MIRYLPNDHPLQNINEELKKNLIKAQSNLLHLQFSSAGELCEKAFLELHIDCPVPRSLYDQPLTAVTNLSYRQTFELFEMMLTKESIPGIVNHASNLAERIQLIQAFENPREVLSYIEEKVTKIANDFPRKAEDIEKGRNAGDVIDPYILAAAQYLLYHGQFNKAVESMVAHKALMIIEGLLGHLHEDVIGFMRGNVRAPEPRGKNQDVLDPSTNPFPGADVIQPPWSFDRPVRFYQLKSKTGSAKGGDGVRLGIQLQQLQNYYGGDIYYTSLIGNTLDGHRSKSAVERVAPKVVVLVGESSFYELTGSKNGANLLLQVYHAAFIEVARKSGYKLEIIAAGIAKTFEDQAKESGNTYLEKILNNVTKGFPDKQDNRLYNSSKRRRRRDPI